VAKAAEIEETAVEEEVEKIEEIEIIDAIIEKAPDKAIDLNSQWRVSQVKRVIEGEN